MIARRRSGRRFHHPARAARAGVPREIAPVVVRAGVDDDGRAAGSVDSKNDFVHDPTG